MRHINDRITMVTQSILNIYKESKIDHSLEVFCEIILIAKILRYRIGKEEGKNFLKLRTIKKLTKEIMKNIKKDKEYPIINNFISYIIRNWIFNIRCNLN